METTPSQNNEIKEVENGAENPYQLHTNVYPTLRTIVLALCVILAVSIVLFLIYQNGKSIYANGI